MLDALDSKRDILKETEFAEGRIKSKKKSGSLNKLKKMVAMAWEIKREKEKRSNGRQVGKQLPARIEDRGT
jgi:hypothetical protein